MTQIEMGQMVFKIVEGPKTALARRLSNEKLNHHIEKLINQNRQQHDANKREANKPLIY